MSQTTTLESSSNIELAIRVPLPPSSSTLHVSSAHQSEHDSHSEVSSTLNESSLAPVDGGFGAWSFLAAAFFVEAVVWGFPNSYGAFLEAYLGDPVYSSQRNAKSLLPLIGPVSSGIIYCSGPLIYPLTARHPSHRKKFIWAGATLCWTSLFAASFITRIPLLVLFQGVLYAVGGALLYTPCVSYMSEWFVEKRGLANGVIFAGTAVGGLILPLALPQLVSKFGISKTVRVLSACIAVLLAISLPFVKGRLPASRVRGPTARAIGDRQWLRNKSLWFLLAANTVQGFGYFVPIVWLPTFASALQLSSTEASLTISLLNGTSVLGRLSMGFLSDKLNPWLLALFTLSCTSIATFILWGVLSHTFAGLIAFGLVYGVSAGGFTSLYTGFVRPIAKDDPTLTTTLFGYLMLSRGIGNILSTPISSAISSSSSRFGRNTGFAVDGGKYGGMILYVGTCFAGAAIVALVGWGVERRRDVYRR